MAVIAVGIEGRRRNRVDSIRTNQLLDVHDIRVHGIVGAGAGPEHALGVSSLSSQFLPTVGAENSQIALICQLAVGNGDFSLDTLQCGLLLRTFRRFKFSFNNLVDRRIDTADEETSDACHFAYITAGGRKLLEAGY